MGNYTIFEMFENPRRDGQGRNFTSVPKILDLKSSSEHPTSIFGKYLSAPDILPVPYQMNTDCSKDAVNFNPGLSQILYKVFFSKNMRLKPSTKRCYNNPDFFKSVRRF